MPRRKKPAALPEYDYEMSNGVVYFVLKGRAQHDTIVAKVSQTKWPYVSAYNWYLGQSEYPVCYELGMMQLHRFVYGLILGEKLPEGFCVDHIDRDRLNNTDANLRLATFQENSFNRTTKSNFKGVKKISQNNYSATVVKNGIPHTIKNIASAEAAAEIYNLMAQELFGEFAACNEIKSQN